MGSIQRQWARSLTKEEEENQELKQYLLHEKICYTVKLYTKTAFL